MISHSTLIGFHGSQRGGLTVQDLLDLLKSVPAKARQNYVMVAGMGDVVGIQMAQSDQAEKWDFKVYITTAKETT